MKRKISAAAFSPHGFLDLLSMIPMMAAETGSSLG
jgi:hypothetical protein